MLLVITSCRESILSPLSTPETELDQRQEPESDTLTLPPAENGWALSPIQNNAAPMVLCHNPIWSYFRFVIMEWRCGHFGTIKMDCIHLALVKVFQELHTWQMLAFGLEFQRGLMWHVGFVHVLASSHVCTVYDEGVSSRVKWRIVVPNVDLMWLFMPFS